MWFSGSKGASGFSSRSTAEEVTHGVDGTGLTAIVTGGAATTCYVALNPQVAGVTGEYFLDSNIAKPLPLVKDTELAKKVWDFSTKLTDSQSRESSS
ncbi:unnamed protein product [Arabidopsis lyrata]|nr:unnamed protein product [Arabidopsis lyrata]